MCVCVGREVTLNDTCSEASILPCRNVTGAHEMLVVFSFLMELQIAPEVTTKCPP